MGGALTRSTSPPRSHNAMITATAAHAYFTGRAYQSGTAVIEMVSPRSSVSLTTWPAAMPS